MSALSHHLSPRTHVVVAAPEAPDADVGLLSDTGTRGLWAQADRFAGRLLLVLAIGHARREIKHPDHSDMSIFGWCVVSRTMLGTCRPTLNHTSWAKLY